MSKPLFIIIAGPNGAGKSTSSETILKTYGVKAFDWDAEFYKNWGRCDFDPIVENGARERTTEMFEEHLEKAFSEKENVAYETNFHIDDHFEREQLAKDKGFETALIFFFVDDTETCNQRVKIRYDSGGHFVNEKTVKYRWEEGLKRLNKALTEFHQVLIFNTSNDFKIELDAIIANSKLLIWDDKSKLPTHLPNIKYLEKTKLDNI